MLYSENSNGVPTPEPSIVVFADVLGFKYQLGEAFATGDGPEFLLRLKQAVHQATEPFRQRFTDCDYRIFSDSVIVGWPNRLRTRVTHLDGQGRTHDFVATRTDYDALRLIRPLADFQLAMIRSGFLIRGSVAVGEHYMDSDLVAGPALVAAASQESERSPAGRRPRLNLHRSFISAMNAGLIPIAADWSKPFDQGDWTMQHVIGIACDQHGAPSLGEGPRNYFLDYLELHLLNSAGPDERPKVTEFLELHRRLIRSGKLSTAPDVREKYEWLARYHDSFCMRRAASGYQAYCV